MKKIETTSTDARKTAWPHAAPGLSELAHHAMARLCAEQAAGRVSRATIKAMGDPLPTALAYALCDDEDTAANALVDDLLKAGLSVEDVCLEHLAPAARRLGEWWETDRVPFTDVTLATARMQSMLRRMPASRVSVRCANGRGAMFAAVPGEEHTFGIMMAADLFRRHGWDVGLMVGCTHDELIARLARDDRPVIGLSCSGDHSFPALKRLMHGLRKNRPNAQVLLSGQIVQNAARIDDLPQPFTVVRDVTEAETVMTDLEKNLSDAMVSATTIKAALS